MEATLVKEELKFITTTHGPKCVAMGGMIMAHRQCVGS